MACPIRAPGDRKSGDRTTDGEAHPAVAGANSPMSPIGTRCLRRLFLWLLVAQQVLAGAGIALPCAAANAGSTERYPCERCGCGCRSARQCWTRCSCSTMEQKIAWARQNGVAVPDFALAAARRDATSAGKPRCARRCAGKGCPLAAARSQAVRTPSNASHAIQRRRFSGGISWLRALRCQGVTQQWQAVTESWPGDRHVEFGLVLPPRGCVALQPFFKRLFSAPSPPTPPPKAA